MKKKILLADDDESVRKMVGRVLETAGYAVLPATTGQEAVARHQSGQPDLVLLDLKMPDHDGWESFKQISEANPLVPVIVITAWPNQYDEAVQRGIDALMEKPLDIALLLQTIQDLLAESEQDRARRLTDRNFTTTLLTPAGRMG
jgi:CheY-like chemotaxis protein